MDVGILLLFYAVYYGVMARDLAEICAEKIASGLGYYTPSGIPSREELLLVLGVLWHIDNLYIDVIFSRMKNYLL